MSSDESSRAAPGPDGSQEPYTLELSAETHAELKRVADRHLKGGSGDQSIQATALVGECYDKLGRKEREDFHSRSHFFASASRAMWQILVDRARKRASKKRGGDRKRLSVSVLELYEQPRDVDVLDLHDILTEMAEVDPLARKVVDLKFFANLTMQEIADHLGLKIGKVEEEWAWAKLWIRRQLEVRGR